MKIGILTFHWATNYGAVLQAYALQEYLIEQGHDVEIINYKPKQFDFSYLNFIKHPKSLFSFKKVMFNKRKEKIIQIFREQYLIMTERYYSFDEVSRMISKYELLISGSDQVLNPSFALKGEGRESPVYFLSFKGSKVKKIGYAVSFGCTQYPSKAASIVSEWVQSFDKIGVREDTGLNVLKQLGFYKDQHLVPDPTILRGEKLFKDILSIETSPTYSNYVCVYMLRRKLKCSLENAVTIDETHDIYSLEQWLRLIAHAKFLITNSYHGMIMALLFHVPFAVLLESKGAVGMNDRFWTLLSKVGLESQIVEKDSATIEMISNHNIDWVDVDDKIADYKKNGVDFLTF